MLFESSELSTDALPRSGLGEWSVSRERHEQIQPIINQLDSIYRASRNPDRVTALEAMLFLRQFLGTPHRDLADIQTVLSAKLRRPGLSDVVREAIQSAINLGNEPRVGIMLPDLPAHQEVGSIGAEDVEDDDSAPRVASYSLAGGQNTDVIAGGRFPDEHLRPVHEDAYVVRRRELERQFSDLERVATVAAVRKPFSEDREALVDEAEVLARGLVECAEDLRAGFGFDASVIRLRSTEAFLQEYFSALDRWSDDEENLNTMVRAYIALRARFRLFLRHEAMLMERQREPIHLSPEAVLGITGVLSEDVVNQAYDLRMRVLDPDAPEDAKAIRELHDARESLLSRLEQQSGATQRELGALHADSPSPWEQDEGSVPALEEEQAIPLDDDAILPLDDAGIEAPPVSDSAALPPYRFVSLKEMPDAPYPLSPWEWEDEGTSAHLPDYELQPHKFLHVSSKADRATIERAYADAAEMLDFDKGEDRREIGKLMRARDLMLARLERPAFAEDAKTLPSRREVPEPSAYQRLGIPQGADRATIERAYASATEMLDSDRREDRKEIAELQRAMDEALYRLEPPRLDVSALTQSESVASRPVSALSENSGQLAATQVMHMPHRDRNVGRADGDKEGFLSRTFRAPGRLIRTLFGAAALSTVAGVAVHEFAEHESDEPKIEEAAPVIVDASEAAAARGIVTAPSLEMSGAPRGETVKHLTPEALRRPGDTVWNVVIDMLRDRGLSTSHPQVQYFTHKALEHNGLTALAAKDLTTQRYLDFTGIAHEMDELAGVETVEVGSLADVVRVQAEQEKTRAMFGGSEASPETGIALSAANGPAYSDLPVAERPVHVKREGEQLYKLVHHMLRDRGLNWTSERINLIKQVVLDENADLFRVMVSEGTMKNMNEMSIPVGARLNFAKAIAILDDMEKAKRQGKKAKTVKQLAAEYGYKYPLVPQFPAVKE